MTDVDGDDLAGAALEQAVREAAGGGTGVEGPATGDVELEAGQGAVELLTPAAHVAGTGEELDRLTRGDEARRLVRDRAGHGDGVVVDRRLGGGAAGDQSPPDELDVEAAADGH